MREGVGGRKREGVDRGERGWRERVGGKEREGDGDPWRKGKKKSRGRREGCGRNGGNRDGGKE